MKQPHKTILIVAHHYPPHIGGLEIVAQQQARSFAKAGNHVSVVTSATHGQTPGATLEGKVTVHRARTLNFFDDHFAIPFPLGGIGLISRLYKEIGAADAVYLHDIFYQPSWITYLIARLRNKPIYLTQHVAMVKHSSAFVMTIERIVYATWGRLIFNYSNAILVYNHNVKKFLIERGVDPSKILELRNGIDLSKFHPAKAGEKSKLREYFKLPLHKPLALFVGRFVPKKGFKTLLEANSPDYDLVFAGTGDVPGNWLNTPGIHIMGSQSQSELAKLYRAADLFVLPAQGEMFTLAMQEAMASGLPIITTDEPGYKKYDIDRSLIALVEPTPHELKKRIGHLVADKQLREKMGSYSVALAKKWFDWETNIKTVLTSHDDLAMRRFPVTVTTSWDDGHVLDKKLAALLKKYNLAGTFYIAPENHEIVKNDRLSKKEVAALAKNFEIGAHTMMHPRLPQVDLETARYEITTSKTTLEAWTGQTIVSFCYPGGAYTPAHLQIVEDAGFSLGRTVQRFRTKIKGNPYELPTTIHAYRHWSDALPIIREGGMSNFLNYYLNWDELAIALFDKTLATGGVFHLWGHSWEIEKNGDWERLERVFKYISNRPEVRYLPNGELSL